MSDERPFLRKDFASIVQGALDSLAAGREVLDDATEGGVLRTLVEAFARELAVCYEQLESVYEAGYLATAEGAALDKVVELLGVSRHEAGWVEGQALFSRATAAPFDVDIPAGTLVAGRGVQGFETVAKATLEVGQKEVRVPLRSVEPTGTPVEPKKLSVLNRPIAGIENVVNPGALLPRREPESDAELRTRALGTIRGGATATVSALERCVRALGIIEVEVAEDPARPGRVRVVLGDADLLPAEVDEAERRLQEVRPAGVRVEVFQALPIRIQVRATLQLDAELDPGEEALLRGELGSRLAAFFAGLPTNETVRWNKIRNLLSAHPRVTEVEPPTGDDEPWPLLPVDEEGTPLADDDSGPSRRLGTADAPVGIFIGATERARLDGIQLELQPPVLPVWIDVEAEYQGENRSAAESALREGLEAILPTGPLRAPLGLSWDYLQTRLAQHLQERSVEGIVAPSLRFAFLHSRDGRVVIVAEGAEASEQDTLAVREATVVRALRLRAPEGA